MHKFNDKCIRWAGVDGLYIGYNTSKVDRNGFMCINSLDELDGNLLLFS